mmetsp:Transcript_112101/g.215933  ORF Transcript_112101/g.215933 Transcript_112101/m.215933 type:complete len:123 (+) Transcript_112101:259-627(+)
MQEYSTISTNFRMRAFELHCAGGHFVRSTSALRGGHDYWAWPNVHAAVLSNVLLLRMVRYYLSSWTTGAGGLGLHLVLLDNHHKHDNNIGDAVPSSQSVTECYEGSSNKSMQKCCHSCVVDG